MTEGRWTEAIVGQEVNICMFTMPEQKKLNLILIDATRGQDTEAFTVMKDIRYRVRNGGLSILFLNINDVHNIVQ